MLDYSITARAVNGGSEALKGFAALNLGGVFVVEDIAICYSAEKNQHYITMPSYATNKTGEDGHHVRQSYCCPTNKEFYKELSERIIDCLLNNPQKTVTFCDGEQMMAPVFSTEVHLWEAEGNNIKGFCNVKFDDKFMVSNIKLREKEDGSLRICMPAKKTGNKNQDNIDKYKDVCFPVNKEFYSQLRESIVNTYQAELNTKKEMGLEKQPQQQPTRRSNTR